MSAVSRIRKAQARGIMRKRGVGQGGGGGGGKRKRRMTTNEVAEEVKEVEELQEVEEKAGQEAWQRREGTSRQERNEWSKSNGKWYQGKGSTSAFHLGAPPTSRPPGSCNSQTRNAPSQQPATCQTWALASSQASTRRAALCFRHR
eukprot:768782-Hanusia_phi.AAC.2